MQLKQNAITLLTRLVYYKPSGFRMLSRQCGSAYTKMMNHDTKQELSDLLFVFFFWKRWCTCWQLFPRAPVHRLSALLSFPLTHQQFQNVNQLPRSVIFSLFLQSHKQRIQTTVTEVKIKGQRCSSVGRGLTQHAPSPEFNPQHWVQWFTFVITADFTGKWRQECSRSFLAEFNFSLG